MCCMDKHDNKRDTSMSLQRLNAMKRENYVLILRIDAKVVFCINFCIVSLTFAAPYNGIYGYAKCTGLENVAL